MLSDEEKKAIESFKEENNNDLSRFDDFNSYTQFKVKRDKLIIALIEKQSKEIEELQNADLTIVYLNGVYDGEKKVEDKIKAKIEPRLKELDEQMKKEWKEYGNSREYQDMEDEWNLLQSLLEKE